MRPAADDDFVLCPNAPYGQVFVLPSQRLVRPAADDDFIKIISTKQLQSRSFSDNKNALTTSRH